MTGVFHWALWAVALFLVVGGLANIVGPAALRRDYARWGYPAWFRFVTGLLLAAAGISIILPALFWCGLVLAALVTLAAVATLLVHREYGHTPPSLVLLALLAWLGYLHS